MDGNMESYCLYNINGPSRWYRLTSPFRRLWVYCANHGKPIAPPTTYPRHAPRSGWMRAPPSAWQRRQGLAFRLGEAPPPPRRQPSETELEIQEQQAFLEYQQASPAHAYISTELEKSHLYDPQASSASFERSDRDGWGSLEQTLHEGKHPARPQSFFVRFDRLNRVTIADQAVEIKTTPPPLESSDDEVPDEAPAPKAYGWLSLAERINLLDKPPPSKPERKKETEEYLSKVVRQYEIPRGPRTKFQKFLSKMRRAEPPRSSAHKRPDRVGTGLECPVPIADRPRVPTPVFKKEDGHVLASTNGKCSPPDSGRPCAPKTVHWAGSEERRSVPRPKRPRTLPHILKRPDMCRWAYTENKRPDPEASNPNCGKQQELVRRSMQEESKAEQVTVTKQSKKISKKQRRLGRKRQNKIAPAALDPIASRAAPVSQDDSEESLVEIDLETLRAKRNREDLQREVSNEQSKIRPMAGPRIIQVQPAGIWSGEHKSHTQAVRPLPLVPKEATRVSGTATVHPVGRPLLIPQGTHRPLPASPTKVSAQEKLQLASTTPSPSQPKHQLFQKVHPHVLPGRVEEIPQSITEGTRQLSCRVFTPEDLEEIADNSGKVKLGKGTFGEVSLMRLRSSDRPLVAVKTFLKFVKEREIFKEVEAMQVAQEHWAFPRLHGVVRNGKYSSIVLDFIGDSTNLMSQTVQNAILQKKHMKFINNWIWIATDITRGLYYLHSKGFLHCDLKTNNALLWHDGRIWRAKIIDMGKACRKEEAEGPLGFTEAQKRENLERFPHIPHEVITGREGYTVAGDIYSLGCVFLQIANVSPCKAEMIQLGKRCYEEDPKLRPALPRVIEVLMSLAERSPWKPSQMTRSVV